MSTTAADGANLLSNPSFESGGASWALSGPAAVQSAAWAASAGDAGVWFRGFEAGATSLSQSAVAPVAGEYVLLFDSRVESNFSTVADSLAVSLGSVSNSVSQNLYETASPSFGAYVLSLPGVSAGETLTVAANSNHAGGTGPQLSAFVDNFYLAPATNMRSSPLFDGERVDIRAGVANPVINNWGGQFNAGSTSGVSLQSAVTRSGSGAYRVDLGTAAPGQTKFFQTFATELTSLAGRNTRDLTYFEAFETYVRNDTGADLTFELELKDYRDTVAHSATRPFTIPAGAGWTKVSTPLDLGSGWSVSGSPQLDQTYAMSFRVRPDSQTASGAIYLDDARLIEPGGALNPLTAPIGDVAEALARRTFHGLWAQRSRQSGIVPNTSTTAALGALNATTGLVWALPSAVRRGWITQADADGYMSQLTDTLNHNLDQTSYLPSRFLGLTTGDREPEESTIDAAFLAIALHQYKSQPGLDATLAAKVDQTVNRFNFAAFAFGDGWGFGFQNGAAISGRYTGYTTEGKTISLAAELSDAHHVDLEQLWHSDTFRARDYLAEPELASLMYAGSEHRAPFSLALVNLFLDLSDRGRDNYPTVSQQDNPWHNFKDYEADTAAYLAELDRPYFMQPDAGQGGPPSDYAAYSLYNLRPVGGETNEDLLMPWSAALALLSGAPEGEMALRFLLQHDLHGPLGMADAARWDTGADAPSTVGAMQDNWNLTLSLMALLRYVDGLEGGARLLADLPQVSEALDNLFYAADAGDYDADRDVDARDLQLWAQALGTADLAADGTGDRIVDGRDFLLWQRHFGFDASTAAAATNVPEPGALALLLVAAGLLRMRHARATAL
ncbi:MAG: hypothetical protein CMJ58_14385 [Planctomycetaceae bacterium]|nr:hypothetical protein [Planctomycetaceae bacterium]